MKWVPEEQRNQEKEERAIKKAEKQKEEKLRKQKDNFKKVLISKHKSSSTADSLHSLNNRFQSDFQNPSLKNAALANYKSS